MTYQAITTKFLPATNTRCSRIKATTTTGSITISYHNDMNTDIEKHRHAAMLLVKKMEWKEENWIPGALGDGYVWVLAPSV